MKKTLLFILFVNFLSAQHPDLINTNWKVTKIVSELLPNDLTPPPMNYGQQTVFSTTDPKFTLSFFNTIQGDVTYNEQDKFTINNRICTLGDYQDDNGEVNQFFGFLCNFFNNDSNYFYTIENTGNQKKLIVTIPTFDAVHFESVNLASNDNNFSQIVIGPNPVKEILNISGKENLNSIKIYDLNGKQIITKSLDGEKQATIDVRNLSSGVYLLKINDQKSIKFIKK